MSQSDDEQQYSVSRRPPLSKEQVADLDALRKRLDDEDHPMASDEVAIRKFLWGFEWNIDEAETHLREAIAWRREFEVDSFLSDPAVAKALEFYNSIGTFVLLDEVDLENRPVLVIHAGRHNPEMPNSDLTDYLRCLVLLLERALAKARENGVEQVTAFLNMDNFGWSNFEKNSTKDAVTILQSYYPETLHTLYIVNEPFIFKAIWKVMQPFIDADTKQKIQMLGSAQKSAVKEQLLGKVFDDAHLPQWLGGKVAEDYQPEIDAFTYTGDVPVYSELLETYRQLYAMQEEAETEPSNDADEESQTGKSTDMPASSSPSGSLATAAASSESQSTSVPRQVASSEFQQHASSRPMPNFQEQIEREQAENSEEARAKQWQRDQQMLATTSATHKGVPSRQAVNPRTRTARGAEHGASAFGSNAPPPMPKDAFFDQMDA